MNRKYTFLVVIFFGVFFKSYSQCWTFASGGRQNSFAIKTDSTLWGWGDNSYGQLADGTFNNYGINEPRQISNEHVWESVSVGQFHIVAKKTDGTLWAWGNNEFGQLGIGTNDYGTNANTPIQIGIATDWEKILAAGNHNVAIKTDGTLWSWGNNFYGQLGDGTNIDKYSPTQIGTSHSWKSVSIAGYNTLALQTDGSLWSWGRNDLGQLGDGTIVDKNIPTRIGTSADWESISAGDFNASAIKHDGTLWTWGCNGTYSPVQIGTDNDWKFISSGNCYTIAIKTDSTLWSWGNNAWGVLGNGTNINESIPAKVGVLHSWIAIYAAKSGEHVLSVKADNSLWAWGYNGFGQLGIDTWADTTIPTQIACIPGSVVPIRLISFNAFIESKNVQLQWETSQEINTSKFEIQKSTNLNEWVSIGTVKAISNSNSVYNYSFTDYNFNKTCYYRLRVVDLDGKTSYSTIRRVVITRGPDISFYPNPAIQSITLINSDNIEIKKIVLTDLLGQKVLDGTINIQKIDISKLKNGAYILSIFSAEKTYHLKLIKQ